MKEVVENFSETLAALEKPLPAPKLHVSEVKIDSIIDRSNWSLISDGKKLEPLRFSNNKTQADVVDEVVKLIKEGTKVVFVHGVCGTGKSAIALNIARQLGRASVVVPVKALQQQYGDDYMGKKQVLKTNGAKMRISMITGRDNHQSIVKQGASCSDPFLPDTIKITEHNYKQLREFYMQNPFIENKGEPTLKDLKRISIAPANPYWSPIVPAHVDLALKDARKKKYRGLGGKDFIFYHRKEGCSYYDQYQSYIDSDVIIFNSAKYKIETALNRKPATEVEIIDEADEFLDSLSNQQSLNLTRLATALALLKPAEPSLQEKAARMEEIIRLEERQRGALGINENEIVRLQDTRLEKLMSLLLDYQELSEDLDEYNYLTHAYEVARTFESFFDDTYLTYRRDEKDLVIGLVTTNLSKQFSEIVSKNKALVLMSGTLHSPEIIKSVFGIDNFKIVSAETKSPGIIEIMRVGKEFDCRYSNFGSQRYTREQYLKVLDDVVSKAPRPTLVHVNSFEDLPTEMEKQQYNLKNSVTKEYLKEAQFNDKNNRLVSLFKAKMSPILFTTKCARGVDFPGDTCNSIVFTKFPNAHPGETFWKVLQKTHSNYFWEFYRDKASREFLQRTYRALRSKNDHVYVLSPDTRVLEAARELQMKTR